MDCLFRMKAKHSGFFYVLKLWLEFWAVTFEIYCKFVMWILEFFTSIKILLAAQESKNSYITILTFRQTRTQQRLLELPQSMLNDLKLS